MAKPVWDLAQWSSKYPLQPGDCFSASPTLVCSNSAKRVVVGTPGSPAADLSLAANAGAEYPRARRSPSEPWVHLLVQQDFENPPALGEVGVLHFHLEARLKRSVLVSSNDYSPSLHAAQYFVCFTVANRNPKVAGYGECFWFGIPIYDNRHRLVPADEAQDFGETKLFLFTPASESFARARGFIKGSPDLADYRPLAIFIGWEVPGMFEVDLQIRNLSLKAIPKP